MLDTAGLARLAEDFHREHEKTYGYRSNEENVRLTGGGGQLADGGAARVDRVPRRGPTIVVERR